MMADPIDEKEYFCLQDIVAGINRDCLEVKKWSVTSASIVAVIGQVGLSNLVPILWIILILSISFWLTETVWRVNQWSFIRRIRQLEVKSPRNPQISHSWARFYMGQASAEQPGRQWDRDQAEGSLAGSFKRFIALETCLPHGVIAMVAVVALILMASGWLSFASDGPKIQHIAGKLDVHLDDQARVAPSQRLNSKP